MMMYHDSNVIAAGLNSTITCSRHKRTNRGACMKKIVAGLVFILVLAGVGMPFVSGMIMEKGFNRCMEQANSMYSETGTGTRIELVSYDRGFSSSEIVWKIHLAEMKTIYKVDEIIFIDRAKHGHTGVVSQTSLEKNGWYQNIVKEKLGGVDPLNIRTDYSLMGDINSVININAFSVDIEGEVLNVKPAELTFAADHTFKQFISKGAWQGASVEGQVDLGEVSFASDMKMISAFIWDGDLSLGLKKLVANDKETPVKMENLNAKYALKFNEKNNTLSVDAAYGFDSITIKTEYVNNASAHLGVNGLDVVAYEEAMALYMKMAATLFDELGSMEENPEQAKAVIEAKMTEISFQMMAIYEKFLKGGLEIYVKDLKAELPQGKIHGNFMLRLEKDLTMAQMFPMMNQPQMIFDYISFASDFSLPSVLVSGNQQLTNPIYPGMKTGLFVEEGENMIHKSETKDKAFFINGEKLVLN